jgi:hypothetical protein
LPDDTRIAAELPLPQAVADYQHARRAGLVLARGEGASKERRYAKRGKHVRRYLQAGDYFSFVRACQRSAPGLRRRQMLESVYLGTIVEEIRGRHRVAAFVQCHHQAARIAIGQRFQQDGIDHAEDGRVRADAQGQNQDGGKREPRTFE